jgi:hypothetical protein
MSKNHSTTNSEKNFLPVTAENNDGRIGSGAPQIKAVTSATTNNSLPPLLDGQSLVSNKPINSNRPTSYFALKAYHAKRIKFDEDGTERSAKYIANHNTGINGWVKDLSKRRGIPRTGNENDLLLVGDELGVNFFDSLGEHLQYLQEKGYSPDTINDRKSVMWRVRESWLELIRTSGLPESFNEALGCLIDVSGKTIAAIAAKAKIPEPTLRRWAAGVSLLKRESIPAVARLEDVFGVMRGTLTSRLEHLVVLYGDCPYETGTTPWRQHMGKLQGYHYRLKAFTHTLESEFSDLVSFFTDDVWLANHGFERNSEWRIDPDGNIPSANRVRSDLSGFMGRLVLAPNTANTWLNGVGMSPELLSIALMSDATLVLGHVEFMRVRSYSQSYNSGMLSFLNNCTSWLRKGTGFLRQQPHYGAKLPKAVAPEDWDCWCEENREKILKFIKTIKKSKNRPVVMTRDPFAAVRNFIEDLEHPVSVLIEMTENMKRRIPLLRKGCAVVLAGHMRDIFFAEFLTSYPLRIKNLSRMKLNLRMLDDARPALEEADDMNLYRRPDGSWWIQYTKREMKNGVAVDVPVAKSVVPILEEYLFTHRPVLIKAMKDAINCRRAKLGMSLLNAEEEQAIELNPYVFRQGPCAAHSMKKKQLEKYTGAENMTENLLSERMLHMSQRYIPNCKGFSAHAVRHLVASDYIKNRPDGYEAAAAALNDSVATVRKHYAWVSPCDKIRPWQDYFEDLRNQFGGGSSTPAAVVAA